MKPTEWERLLENMTEFEPQEQAKKGSAYSYLQEHPTWNAGTAESWEPEARQDYGMQHSYDRVVQTRTRSKVKAEEHLRSYCQEHNVRRVSRMFYAGGYWCIRVKNIEENV